MSGTQTSMEHTQCADVFPAEAGWIDPEEPKRRSSRLRRTRAGRAWLAFRSMGLPEQIVCALALLGLIVCFALTSSGIALLLIPAGALAVIIVAARSLVRYCARHRALRRAHYAVMPNRTGMLDRARQGAGDALPDYESRDAASGSVSASSDLSVSSPEPVASIPGAGPLAVSTGVIVDTLRLRIYVDWDIDRGVDGEYRFGATRRTPYWMHYARVRFRDDQGQDCDVWTNALRSWLAPGDAVAVYWYRALYRGTPCVRVHDVARSGAPQDVALHAASVFSLSLANDADGLVFGRDDESSGSFGDAMLAQPWGRDYLTWVTRVGYTDTGRAPSVLKRTRNQRKADAAVERIEHTRPYDIMTDDIALDPEAVRASRCTVAMSRHAGIVRRVVVIPLFNRRSFCGYGYMALVDCAAAGVPEFWAFGDPRRPESYLGRRVDAAVPPVRPGDAVSAWLSGGAAFVEPAL